MKDRDTVTAQQIQTLLNVAGTIAAAAWVPPPGGSLAIPSAVPSEAFTSAEATFINACNAIDRILGDASRWTMEEQKKAESALAEQVKVGLEHTRAHTAAMEEAVTPHYQHHPIVIRLRQGIYAALTGPPEDPEIVGVGPTPVEAVRAFDIVFSGGPPTEFMRHYAAQMEDYEQTMVPNRNGRTSEAEKRRSAAKRNRKKTKPKSEIGSGQKP